MDTTPRQSLIAKIAHLKSERGAVIFAHNYQLGEIQDLADHTGDSLELSVLAAKTTADVIVFCGVRFMAETAHLLNPDKTTLLPVGEAGCLMADMVGVDGLRRLKTEHPDAMVICYVNSTAAVKAESDLCVTSGNALKLVDQLPEDREIIFVPDQNLGDHINKRTGRKMILWEGFCPSHARITPNHILERKSEFPEAEVLIHPESPAESIELADHALSTGGICRRVQESDANEFIIATEIGIIHRLRAENPGKRFIPVSEQAICPDMKLIRLEDVAKSLETMTEKIVIDPELREKARRPIDKMLELST